MSNPIRDALGDVASPLVSLRRFTVHHTLQLAAAIWNIARLPDRCPHRALLDGVAVSAVAPGEAVDEGLAEAVWDVYRRARLVYGGDPRMVELL